jgi:transcription elongation factor Elf1
MPIKSFTCPQCGDQFYRIYGRQEYDATTSAECLECGTDSPADTLPLPARRNPQHGIQK